MNETNINLRHILAVDSNESNDSIIELKPTVDPQIRELIKDGFFLSMIILIFLYILKVIYLCVILCTVITAKNEKQVRHYPPTCNLICDIICGSIMIFVECLGLSSLYWEGTLMLAVIYLVSLGGALFNGFFSLISVCNSEYHNEYTLSFGLISMAIVITESLSLNLGSFYTYYLFLQWSEDNKDKKIDFWPISSLWGY